MTDSELIGKYRLVMKMAKEAMVFDPRDWSQDRTNAWLWALLVGWDEESEKEIVQRHGSAMHGACSLFREIKKAENAHDGVAELEKRVSDLEEAFSRLRMAGRPL